MENHPMSHVNNRKTVQARNYQRVIEGWDEHDYERESKELYER
jgi:hypothetical protein